MPTSRLVSKSHFFRDLDLKSILVPDEEPPVYYGTKIVCTLGPSCHEVEQLTALLRAGMNVARIDLTWGPLEFHCKSLRNLQTALKQERKMCAVMIDTLGREIMIRRQFKLDDMGWPLHDSPLLIPAGSTVTVTTRPVADATETVLPITYEGFTEMVQPGDTLYIGRYLVSGADRASLYLEVQEVQGPDVICVAKNEALLDGLMTVFHSERSSDELNNAQNNLPFLSTYDKDCLESLAAQFEIDFLSTSYTRSDEDVKEARSYLNSIGLSETRVVAKLETRQSVLNLRTILVEADGIMISRGNLGLDVAPEKMAQVQKTVITACNVMGKPVIITRVVDTMVNTPRPTRAEATDIANAVLDGVDGFLLGAETLRGKYPIDTVNTINRICRSAELVFDHNAHHDHLAEVSTAAEEVLALLNLTDDSSSDGFPDGHSGSASPLEEPTAGTHSTHHSGLSGLGGLHAGGHKSSGSMVTFAEGTHHRGPSNLGASQSGFDSSNSLSSMDRAGRAGSYATLTGAMSGLSRGMRSSKGSLAGLGRQDAAVITHAGDPYLVKLESIASSAVRTAERVGASLIVVFTTSGKTAQLVAKYRPPMPIMTLVVPHLVSDGLKWQLKGKAVSRQCLLSRGLLPVLAAPSPSGDALLEESIGLAGNIGLVQPGSHVVCVQRMQRDFCVKVVSVDEIAAGIQRMDPQTGAKIPMDHAALLRTASSLNDRKPLLGGQSPNSPFSTRNARHTEEFVSVLSSRF